MNIKLPISNEATNMKLVQSLDLIAITEVNKIFMKKIILSAIFLLSGYSLFAQWTTSGTNIYNSNTGFVGIGTTSPAFPLDVNGVINCRSYISTTGGFYTNVTRNGFNSSLGANALGFRTNNIDNRMVIDSSGNVGIGIATPSNRLEVVQSNTFSNSNPVTYALDLAQNGANIAIGGYSSGSVVQSFNSLPLMLNPVGNNVIINGGGVSNVLIGETSQVNSSYRLDVNGPVRATGVTVNTTGADFVFDSAYQLTPLDKVEAYIRACHHLPGVATAAQMQKDGMEVGEVTTKLLQKVEELTLYAVVSDRKVSEQELQLSAQQALLLRLQDQLKAQQAEIDRLKAQQSAQH
jgi:hypothetical protein